MDLVDEFGMDPRAAYVAMRDRGRVDPRVAVLLDALDEAGGAWVRTLHLTFIPTQLWADWRAWVPGDPFETRGSVRVERPMDADIARLGRAVAALRAGTSKEGGR